MRLAPALVALALLAASAGALAAEPRELLPDGGFERAPPAGWHVEGGEWAFDAAAARSGGAGAGVPGTGPGGATLTTGLHLAWPGERYTAEAWFRQAEVAQIGAGWVALEWKDEHGRVIGDIRTTVTMAGPEWSIAGVTDVAPPGTVMVEMLVGVVADTGFRVDVDDASLVGPPRYANEAPAPDPAPAPAAPPRDAAPTAEPPFALYALTAGGAGALVALALVTRGRDRRL